MNKKIMLTALLAAVVCQPVSAVPFFSPKAVPTSLMSKMYAKVSSFVGKTNVYKVDALVLVGITVATLSGYKYFTKEKIWVDGNCIKFEKRTLFGMKKGSVCFKTSEEAAAAHQVIKTGHFFGGFSRIQEVAKQQLNHPSVVWKPMPMTDADIDALKFKTRKLIFQSMNK
jgi:hypothetical protein